MKIQVKITTLAFLLLAVGACHDDFFHPKDQDDQRLIANYSLSELNARVRVPEYEEMLSVYDVPATATNGRIRQTATVQEDNYVLVLRAEVSPPVYNKQILKASHVHIDGNRAFVAYNTEGDTYLGGIEIYDISNIRKPVLTGQVVINGSDFSALTYHDNKIYLAGATRSADEKDLSSTAIIEVIALENNQLANTSTLLDVIGFVATDVKIHDDKLYVTSGSNGGLSIYDLNTLELLETKMLDDARSIAFTEDRFVVMQGTPGRVNLYHTADGSLIRSYTVGGASIPESKSMVDIKDNLIFIPAGAEGLKVIDAETGENKLLVPLPQLKDEKPEFLVTNGVSVNGNRSFIANGAAGLYVAQQQNESISIVGSVYFKASTNYVKSQDNIIFVATGVGGLKILEIMEYDPQNGDYITIGDWDEVGVPTYLCEKAGTVDQTLSDHFFSEFISMDDVTLRHPEWFTEGVVTDLTLMEDTDLSITFFHEGAGLKNTLGFYTYNSDDPPPSADALQNMTVLFPNASYEAKGGGLLRGDKICLDEIKAGTSLGFFLATNGFKGDELTKGVYMHHTTTSFNTTHPEGMKQNSLLLYDKDTDTIVLTFEDIRRPGGDKDFDDAAFLIRLGNPAAVDKSQLSSLK